MVVTSKTKREMTGTKCTRLTIKRLRRASKSRKYANSETRNHASRRNIWFKVSGDQDRWSELSFECVP